MISIVMATYNGEKYIKEQLESIKKQTIKPDELIISDDHSTDNTIKIIETYKQEVPFKVIILKNHQNIGYKKNFANVISKTSGDFVFLCDQDDFWFENKIETVLNTFKEHPEIQLVAHNAMCTNSKLEPIDYTLFGDAKRDKKGIVNGCITCIRRDFLQTLQPIPDSYAFDSWFTTIANTLNIRFNLDTVLSYYRRHEEAVTLDEVNSNRSIINQIKLKIKKNLKSFYESRTMDYLDSKYNKEKAVLDYLKKFSGNELPIWLNICLLKENVIKFNLLIDAYRARYDAINHTGLKRLKPILSVLKSGIYNRYFHGVKTAIDDFLRK